MYPNSEIKPAIWNIGDRVYSTASATRSQEVSYFSVHTEVAVQAVYVQREAVLYWGACYPAFSLSKVWKRINDVQRTKP